MEAIKRMNVEENDFKQLFWQISPKEISDNMFTLVMDNFYVITAGNEAHYNSMIGSGGGFGLLFRKPASWCVIRSGQTAILLNLFKRNKHIPSHISPIGIRNSCFF